MWRSAKVVNFLPVYCKNSYAIHSLCYKARVAHSWLDNVERGVCGAHCEVCQRLIGGALAIVRELIQ